MFKILLKLSNLVDFKEVMLKTVIMLSRTGVLYKERFCPLAVVVVKQIVVERSFKYKLQNKSSQ